MPAIPALSAALAAYPVADVPGVLAVMKAIEGALPATDGIVAFNRLYRTTTENIAATLAKGGFSAPAYTTRLDVIFGNYYFKALTQWLADAPATPRPWLELFSRRDQLGIAPLQFALAGMNAHIDRDLAFALEDLAVERGSWPADGSSERGDFLVVNDVLAATERQVKPSLENDALKRVEWIFGGVEDALALYAVKEIREVAWLRGSAQYHLRGTDGEDVIDALGDRAADLIGKVFLEVTGSRKPAGAGPAAT